MTGQSPARADVVSECCFLDVGQGTCNIILLGDNQAIVVDAGPKAFTPVQALRYFGVHEILALIVSHNDADHCGGAVQIVQAFPKRIRQIFFLEDRPSRRTPLLPVIRRELEAGNLTRSPERLETQSPKGKKIYENVSRMLSLHVLFPWMLANIDAREQGGGNRTSALLALQCGRRRIVFGGDLLYDGWRQLRAAYDAPIRCDVLAVPHHGGALCEGDRAHLHAWVYSEAARCSTAIVSVGSNNRWNHPFIEHVHAIRQSGATVVCTQVTPNCCDRIERLRPGVVVPRLPGASSPTLSVSRGSGKSRHVACAGSILVEVGPDYVSIERLSEHGTAVDRLSRAPDGHPLCRP